MRAAFTSIGLLFCLTLPAAAQTAGGPGGAGAATVRSPVSVRVATVGTRCVRALGAVAYDQRLGTILFRLDFDSGPMSSLGVNAYENALLSARTLQEARIGLEAARRDAVIYRREPSACG